MRLALFTSRSDTLTGGDTSSRWAYLPGMCCQAAGGSQEWADQVTLAWLLFYAAADIMDSVQDQDSPHAWWVETGPGAALAAATGLYFTASCVINALYQREETQAVAEDVIRDFYQTLMVMTSGQYNELVTPEPSLEQYWKYVEAKSGAFFSLACRIGARLATSEETALRGFSEYGKHLGILIQILDDLEDIRLLQAPTPPGLLRKIRRSLPFAYAFEVSDPVQKERLFTLLRSDANEGESVEELIKLVDQCGAALYVMAEIDKRRRLSIDALQVTNLPADLVENLAILVRDL